VNKDGQVTALDAQVGGQFLGGQIPADAINLLNMASVHHDQSSGDRCKQNDCTDILRYVAGRLNCYFQ
jgi:hypothetical protein